MSLREPPDGIAVHETPIAVTWLHPDGILVSRSKPVRRTVENLSENLAVVRRITGGRRMPLLVFLTDSPVPDKAARTFSAEQVPLAYTAMAMVSPPGLSQLIMKLVFRLQSPPIPMRSFSDGEEARRWLLSLPASAE